MLRLSSLALLSATSLADTLQTACNDLEDGEQWIRPIEGEDEDGNEYPNIKVRCTDGWTLLDPTLDDDDYQNDLAPYFSSFSYWTDAVVSSSLDDHVTWEEWFLPADSDFSYRVSADCQTCDEGDDNTVYYMTGNYVGCLWVTKGYCDMDSDTMECYTCTAPNYGDEEFSGLCTHMEAAPDTSVNSEHDDCVGTSFNEEPSIGGNGQYCVCYKPSEASEVSEAQYLDKEVEEEVEEQSADTVVELTAKDFETGTYRVTQPGTYMIMEDIEFNMNPPEDYSSPNADGAWWPDNDPDAYPGSDGSFVGAYSMGFFAGLSIEAEGVTVDLQGHTLKMGAEFHLQQRWFSIIELASKAFLSGQGPGNFGAFMDYGQSVTIQNGVLGLSSHHGIHGNGCSDVTLKNLQIKDFEVGGIAINGFDGVVMEDVEVGPVNTRVPTLGVFTQARIMLGRLRAVVEENPDGEVTFANREGTYTAQDVLDELEAQMDMVFDTWINGEEWGDDERSLAAKELFHNENQLPPASTVYGIFLNSLGASVFAIGGAPGSSYNAKLTNVKIHGLYNDPWEVPRIVLTKGPMNDIMDLSRVSTGGLENIKQSEYVGSAYTDAQLVVNQLSEAWSILGHSVMSSSVSRWITTNRHMRSAKMRCNNDIMLHVTKGVFGLRVDSVDTFEFDNVEIYDLQNVGVLGSYLCGAYEGEATGGHRNQNYPLQYGYTGTEVHAMTFIRSTGTADNIVIKDILSARGDAIAVQLFPGNEITLGKLDISDIHAGAFLPLDSLPDENMPNKIPRACAVDLWTWFDEDDDDYPENDVTYNVDDITATCLTGHQACTAYEWDEEVVSDFGDCSADNLVSSGVIAGEVYAALSDSPVHAPLLHVLSHQGVLRPDTAVRRTPKGTPGLNWPVSYVVFVASLVAVLATAGYAAHAHFAKVKTAKAVAATNTDARQSETQPLKSTTEYGSLQ